MSAVEHQFEPMSTGMVLDGAFRFYAQHFPLMLGISAILNVPILVLTVLPVFLARAGSSPFLAVTAAISSMLIGLVALLVVYPLVTGATTKAVSDTYLGNPVTVGSALKVAWRRFGTLLMAQTVAGMIVLLGFILLVVPGILWMLSYTLIPPVVMIEAAERKGARPVPSPPGDPGRGTPRITDRGEIRRRSWELVKGNRGKVFVVLFVFVVMQVLLATAGNWIAGMGFGAGSNLARAIQSIIGNVVAIVVAPLQTIAITLLYYDFRIRKEGFDLEMLSQAIGKHAVKA
ncbi:MAG: hypothetical protein DMD86_05725 [Candidatus Rokuibacteriota bacterium]|nr:MAG: hypothetical protein DMD86_05725 [Candidatus Rokubacteria bacterium]